MLLIVTVLLKNVKPKPNQTKWGNCFLGDQAVGWVETQHRAPAGWFAGFSTQFTCCKLLSRLQKSKRLAKQNALFSDGFTQISDGVS